MSLELTNLSAFTFSFGPIPYPVPNFNFAYAAGPDGREFLEGDITKYYEANPDDAYYIFKRLLKKQAKAGLLAAS